MYNEVKLINGVLHYRSFPDSPFKPYTKEELSSIIAKKPNIVENMEVKIKDQTNEISVALRAVGYNIDGVTIETILNISDYIRRSSNDVTIKDILQIQKEVEELLYERD